MSAIAASSSDRLNGDLRLRWPGLVVGLIVALIGVVLAIGGAWLALLGGSLYYLVTGAAMVWAGGLLMRGQGLGGLLYLAVVVLTFLWAWWEVGANAWAQVPRVVAPVVLLVPVLLAMATMTWHARRWHFALGGSALALVALGIDLAAAAHGAPQGCRWPFLRRARRAWQTLPASRLAPTGPATAAPGVPGASPRSRRSTRRTWASSNAPG